MQNTFGALEIGATVSVFLFGVATLQVHVYFTRFPDDRRYFKALVRNNFLFRLLELGHTIAVAYELYRTTILLYDAPNVEMMPHPALGAVIILGAYIATLTQIFFCYRLYTVLPPPLRPIGPATALASTARSVLVTYAGAVAISAPSYAAFVARMHRWVTVLLALGAAIDVVIAGAMVYFLLTKRERTHMRTVRLIDRLIAFTLRTGLVTSMAAVSVIVVYKVMPSNLVFLAVYTSFSKLYTNSLLFSFNSRVSPHDSSPASVSAIDILHRPDAHARRPLAPRTSTPFRSLPCARFVLARVLTPNLQFNTANAIAVEMKTATEFRTDDAQLERIRPIYPE
ncbi:hypothetical protein HYPSUDRAFT_68590 [Hypholoma sublateritium FD-334 SS-4]|uniref:DUF6534 domain-containing protein n=1 Tax=Hypholoma sublateritium (strain FD-334 SS-4) TaxID=945553 RepID=A0A0D2PKA6_HYPSF|nr:hypothetical protein HYPSUDRAFT_68590 [Hypholoma sublateritium FD-334 SS-4]